MERALKLWVLCLAGMLVQSCLQAPRPERTPPGPQACHMVAERISAVVLTKGESIQTWADRRFSKMDAHADVDGGSATPITADGYFLTADHVLERMGKGRNVFVLYRWSGTLVTARARVVWRSGPADLALLKAPLKTPYFYEWTPCQEWLPEGTAVIHGGVATGLKTTTGKLASALAPENRFTRVRRFKIDIPLQAGDSGGPVVNAHGGLIGINSAVEFLVPIDTAFFVDSEGSRPNTRMMENLINRDRARNSDMNPVVE